MKQGMHYFRSWIYHPGKVFITCLILVTISLVSSGSLFRILSLRQDMRNIQSEAEITQKEINHLKGQINQAHDPSYIEYQAREYFDLAEEHDLIFLFSESDEEEVRNL